VKLLFLLLRSSWRVVLLASLLGGLSGIANIAILALVHRAVQRQGAALDGVIWLFAGLCVLSLLTRVGSQVFLVGLAQDTISRLLLGLCRRILESPLRHLEEIGSHRMLASLTNDVSIVAMAMNGVPGLCVNAVILLCGIGYLAWLSPSILAGTLLFTGLGLASYWAGAGTARHYLRQSREGQDVLMRHIRSMIEGLKELKLHQARRRAFVEEVLEPTQASVRKNQFLGSCLQDVAISWGRLLFLVAIGLLLFVWPRWQPVDAGVLAGYTLAIFYLMSPLERIVAWLPLMARARIAVGKIESLGLMLQDAAPAAGAVASSARWERIELAAITHRYRCDGVEGGFMLGPIDFTLRPGEVVFVVGGNGSGKTTLAKLITGLYVPEGGEIRWDGQSVTAENREGYRQLFSAVFDDAVVFEGLWGLPTAGLDDRAQRYLQELRLEHVIRVADGTFSTTEVSRGQRKRLTLLTAYLEDRPVYVFDEWAADQDPAFKRTFYLEVVPELQRRGKAIVAITHDDRYFATANRIIKLDEGKVVTP
jgi:putative ATP-binding cassette transporter